MRMVQSKSDLTGGSSPAFCAGRKIDEVQKALLWRLLDEDPEWPSRILLEKAAQAQEPILITVRQVNRVRVTWKLNRRKGRPCRSESDKPAPLGGEVVEVTPRLSFIGVHLFAVWMELAKGDLATFWPY